MAELDKLGLQEYIRRIHKLPWEDFVKEAWRKSGTYYVQALYEKAVDSKAKTIMELGVFIGQSTRALLKAAVETSGHLYSVEANGETLAWVAEALELESLNTSFFTPIHGDELEVAGRWTELIDFLLIDTDHTYKQTVSELETYSKLISMKGIIVLHDTNIPEERQAINDWLKNNEQWIFKDITPTNDGWGLGLLRRKQTT